MALASHLFQLPTPACICLAASKQWTCHLQATDTTFSAKLRENLAHNGRFSWDSRSPDADFTVEHYAGPVTYSCHRFLDKNRDTLSPGVRTCGCPSSGWPSGASITVMLCQKQTLLPRCSPLAMCCWLAYKSEAGVVLVMLYCSESFITAVLPHSDELLLFKPGSLSQVACNAWQELLLGPPPTPAHL